MAFSCAALLFAGGQAAAQATCALPVSPPPSQGRVVFLIDTSGSMEGRGDSVANIFSKIKGAVVRGMRSNTVPGTVELLTFDQGPRKRFSFAWPQERAGFEKTVNTLSAPGANTWLYSSMQSLFSTLGRQDQAATTVYVVTDGRDNNPSKSATIDSAVQLFDSLRGPFDKLYYIALGQQIPPEIGARFASTSFARALALAVGQAPDFTSVSLSPALITVGGDASFPFQHPAGAQLRLESGNIGGASVAIRDPAAAGRRVNLKIQGNVPANSVGYMCTRVAGGDQNVLLRFDTTTPPLNDAPAAPLDVLGTLLLLNPEANLTLQRGQSTVLNYKAVKGPVTVEIQSVPGEIGAALPDQTVSLLEGEQVALKLTDKTLNNGQQVAPVLRLNDQTRYPVPKVTGQVVRPFPWWWLLLALIALLLLWLLISRARRPFRPYALSVDRSLRVFLHDRGGLRRGRLLRRDVTDLGAAFREPRLNGLTLERYKPVIAERDEVLLDNSDIHSLRAYGAQQMRRAARLLAQPDTLRLQKDGQPDGTFLELQETLALRQLYLLTDYVAPPVRVRPPMPPAEPPIEVIVTLLSGTQMQELELPLEDVDLADVFGAPPLHGLVVRREPGLLRLRELPPPMQLRHISREFRAGDALPLAVMLTLTTAGGNYQVRVQDKASADRYRR
ncbi:vWA domain-containing protein [Deinococcus sp. UYEF24]